MNRAGVLFAYEAADALGCVQRGHVTAETQEGAAAQLVARGLFPIGLKREASVNSRRTMPAGELALGLRILSDLLESGLTVARALVAVETVASPRWAHILPDVRASVREGKSLAQALEECPAGIPPVVTGILYAGERGLGLAPATRAASDLCEETAATRSALRSALAYPLLLTATSLASAGLLVGIVLPRFAAILGDMGQDVPASTRILLSLTQGVRAGAVPLLCVILATWASLHAWAHTPDGARRWRELLLRAPWLGETRLAAATAQVCTTMAALLESGVPVAVALQHASRAAGDAAVAARLLAARQLVIEGQRLSHAVETHGALTIIAVRLAHAGEESGRLAAMLAHAGRMERERAVRRVRGTVRLVEPALIIAFGALVAFVAASLLQALYSVRPT